MLIYGRSVVINQSLWVSHLVFDLFLTAIKVLDWTQKKKTNLHHGDFIKVKFDKYECKSVIISCDSVAIVSMTKFLCYNIQGHPTTVFCKISVRRSKF